MKRIQGIEDFDSALRKSREQYKFVAATLAEHNARMRDLEKQLREVAATPQRFAESYRKLVENLLTTFDKMAREAASWRDFEIARGKLKGLTAELLAEQPDHPPLFIVRPTEYATKLTPEMMRHLKGFPEELGELSPEVFEHLIGELLCSNGFEDVRLVGRDNSTAADVFAAKRVSPAGFDLRVFVEVKRRKGKVGFEVVNGVLGAMLGERPKHGWHAAFIVSLSGFKSFKRETPEGLRLQGVELKAGADIACWLDQYRLGNNGLWLAESKYYMPGRKIV